MTDIELLEHRAVNLAMKQAWDEAIKINKKLLTFDKKNLQTFLRLGFAYVQMNKLVEAKRIYKKVIKIQPKNQLALDNLERIKILEKRTSKRARKKDVTFDPRLFLDVPGKTKSVSLVKLGQKKFLAHLVVGQEVLLKPKKRKIEVRTKENEYVGSLPDDLSKTLYLFIRAGSEYSSFIKEVSLSKVVIFIKEQKRGKKFARLASFPKTMPSSIMKLGMDEDSEEGGDDEVELHTDIENLAENLTHEEKDFLPYPVEDDENEDE